MKYKNKRMISRSFMVEEQDWEKLMYLSAEVDVSASAIIRRLIKERISKSRKIR